MALTRITEENITPGSITANSIAEGISLGGGAANAAVYIYDTTLTSNVVLLEGQNGLSIGPVTIANNASINIASGQRWLIL
jgi:hypothetical protein